MTNAEYILQLPFWNFLL